ncbi:hypothetical protein [Virgibacillus proomii]|uniref:hypothetical protein n=1 Tax=Virgibacillus proomii TaxID=84407 RepID=UPI001C122810|nr:hypothetical protein [Virgibacillus proomii]MBU5266598.1 hypothetical protein [Virgibacillus proomii]
MREAVPKFPIRLGDRTRKATSATHRTQKKRSSFSRTRKATSATHRTQKKRSSFSRTRKATSATHRTQKKRSSFSRRIAILNKVSLYLVRALPFVRALLVFVHKRMNR